MNEILIIFYLLFLSFQWVVNDIDITEICREYRAVVVKKCESMEVTLSATEEL